MIKVNVINEYNKLNYKNEFKKISEITSKKLGVNEERVVSVFITNNDTIHEYNKKYRDVDRETDVLSFPSDEVGELGDIIISYDRVISQAIEYGHSEKREICFLFTHGVLHCLGYDHMSEEEEKEMFDLQKEILDEADIRRDL